MNGGISNFLGSNIGKVHNSTIKSVYEGKPCFLTRTIETTSGLRGLSNFSTQISSVEYEDLNYKPLLIVITMNISKATTSIVCDFPKDKKIKITVKTPQNSEVKEFDNNDNILLSWGLNKKMLEKGFKSGTSYSYEMFVPEKFEFLKINTEVMGKEAVEYDGKILNLNKLKTDIKDLNMTKFDYVDDDGVDYISDTPVVGLKFVKSDKKKTPKDEKSHSFDITDVFIKPTGNLGNFENIYNLNKSSMSISTENLVLKDCLIQNSRQELKLIDSKHAKLTIFSTKDKIPSIKLNRPFDQTDLSKLVNDKPKENNNSKNSGFEPYLVDSPFIQSKNEKIKNKAEEIVGSEKDIFRCSILLCQWVNVNLKNKNYSVIYASALEVLENLEGDCSEHTILFIALARSLGIPARGVLGLVYSEKEKAFGFHAWTEVFAGEWIEMDPTLGTVYVTPAHIAVITTDMNDLSFSGDYIKLIQLIKDFHIQID